MPIGSYLQAVGLELDPADVASFALALPPVSVGLSVMTGEALYCYPVPRLGEGGSCSLVNELDEQPYDLRRWFGEGNEAAEVWLQHVQALVEATLQHVPAGWLGVYLKLSRQGQSFLVKLAYRGLPSRAEFPLTEDFALSSNNSRVGLTGRAAVIADVRVWQAEGQAYYECDPAVQSEVCLPVLAADGRVLGILDAESPVSAFFDRRRQSALAALALALVAPFEALPGLVENT